MKRPYCPVCCESIHEVEFHGEDQTVVQRYPCNHVLDNATVTSCLDYIDSATAPERKERRDVYVRLYNAVKE